MIIKISCAQHRQINKSANCTADVGMSCKRLTSFKYHHRNVVSVMKKLGSSCL